MSAEKTNAARNWQNDKKQEKNMVCDEQQDDEVPKTDERAEHWVYCSEESCGNLQCFGCLHYHRKGLKDNCSFADVVLVKKSSSAKCHTWIFTSIFCFNCGNWTNSPAQWADINCSSKQSLWSSDSEKYGQQYYCHWPDYRRRLHCSMWFREKD